MFQTPTSAMWESTGWYARLEYGNAGMAPAWFAELQGKIR
jgi:hypothetical protein